MRNHVAGLTSRRRPIGVTLAILSAAAIVATVSVAYFHGTDVAMAPPLAVPIDMLAPAAADPRGPAAAAMITPGGGPLIGAKAPTAGSAPTSADSSSVRYAFNGGSANPTKGASGDPRLVESTVDGGVLSTVTHLGGDAVDFPPPCPRPGGSRCPRVILQTTGDVARLNPGTGMISYGATVRLGKSQTGDGENVVQKGFATGGSEYKLQVDGDAGKPSCAVVGTASATIYLARSSISVADGKWHVLICELRSHRLTISVDGVVRGKRPVAAGTDITNDDPVRIGGKGTSKNNDQFNGSLDDVWITVPQ